MADLSQILGNNALAGLLSSEQQQQARSQAENMGLLNLALGMIAGSRGVPGQGKPSLVQAAVPALQAGIQGYQGSFDRTLKDLVTGMQVKDLVEKRKAQETLQQRLAAATTLQPVSTGITPGSQQEKLLAAQLEGADQADIDMTRSALMSNVNLPKREVVDQNAAQEAVLGYLRQVSPEKYAELAFKEPKAPTASIQEYTFAQQQGYKGSYEDWVQSKAKAGATTIKLPGDKKLAETLGVKTAERLDSSLTQATAAQSTLQTVSELRPLISQGVFSGPLSGATRTVAQIASKLGITGQSTDEVLQRTAKAMQGLAKFELDAAAAMRGQGAITENERLLIKRAAAGDLKDFTDVEIMSLLGAMEKTSNFKISSHNKMLERFRKSENPEIRDSAVFFELGAIPSAPPASGQPGVKRFNPATGKAE